MRSSRAFHTRTLIVLFLGLAACSGGSGGLGSSCACIKPIALPDGGIGNYQGPKTNNAVSVKVSKKGFDYINANWQTLLNTLTGNPIHVPLACSVDAVNTAGIDGINICDQNFNDQCDTNESCNDIYITIKNFVLTPEASSGANTGKITGEATLAITTGDIGVSTTNKPDECLRISHLETTVNFNNTSDPLTLTVPITLSLDGRIDPTHPLITLSIGTIDGLQNLNSSDLNLTGNNTCGTIYSDLLDAVSGTFMNFLIQQLTPILQGKIDDAVNKQLCRTCGSATEPVCPSGANGGASSTCQSGTCMISGDPQCVPKLLGVQGLIEPGTTLGKYGVPSNTALGISAAAGGSVSSGTNSGLSLGVIGGAASYTGPPPHLAPCVPDLPPPDGGAPPFPDFDSFAPDGGYHVGLGISDFFLNQAAYAAHRSGTMCLAISGNQIDILNTGLFKTFLPSLGLLAGSATQDAPMLVTLRPLQAPHIDIGAGTYDPTTKQPIDPLITITMNQVVIDIYARIEDRWSRLFTMTLNVKLPLSLIIDGCPQGITPAIGDLHNLIQITQAPTNSELLAEDPSVLAGLIPAVIGLAQPALASALQPIAVPSFNGFTLHLDGIEGIGANDGTTFDDLGIFADLKLAGQCDAASVHTQAQIVDKFIPTAAQMHGAAGTPLPWPSATVAVSAKGYDGDIEYDYRVDKGLWTTFKPGPTLTVTSPVLMIEGHHEIDVRGRPAHGNGISDPHPVKLDFLVDWQAPTVHIHQDANGDFQIQASDNVDGPQALEYRYQVGDDAFGDWGPARPLDSDAIRESSKLTVQARDEAGNVGSATWTGVSDVAPSAAAAAGVRPEPIDNQVGCDASGFGGISLFALIALGLGLASRKKR